MTVKNITSETSVLTLCKTSLIIQVPCNYLVKKNFQVCLLIDSVF